MDNQFKEQNYPAKGRFLLFFFIGFALFIALVIYIYKLNAVGVVPVG